MVVWFNRLLAWVTRNIKKIVAFGAVVLVIALAFTTAYSIGYHFMYTDAYATRDEAAHTVTVEIPQEATVAQIAEILVKRGLVNDAWEFRVKARLSGADDDFRFGIYYIQEDATVEEIIATLRAGDQSDVVPFRLAAGSTVDEIADELEEMGICSAADFKKACNMTAYDLEFVTKLPGKAGRRYLLEGYLMPGSYQIIKNSSATNVVKLFLEHFSNEVGAALQQKIIDSGWTLDEVMTMASVVEAECAVKTDLPTFASMLLNRVYSGKEEFNLWQMASTVLYAQMRSTESIAFVSEADKYYNSPYNTFINKGFPPGPICSPSLEAIRAVLYPDSTDYYYYEVDLSNPNGPRHFSKTKEEHEQYIAAE